MKYNLKEELNRRLHDTLKIDVLIEEPKRGDYDLAIPLFRYAKELNKPLLTIFESFKTVLIENEYINEIDFINGFLNIKLNEIRYSKLVLENILEEDVNYATLPSNGKTVVIDYSSPNIAKNFSIGHLRSTVIGHSLKLIYEKSGYKVIGINHLGDWGTSFGKMIVAYLRWGDSQKIKLDPISELQNLYVKFHEEALKDPTLEEEARDVFRKMELGDENYLKLWQVFRKESLKEFTNVYDILKVRFDSYAGEAFYNDKIEAVVDKLADLKLLEIDDGATIVNLGDEMPPALIKRSDGGTLYITRDLTALLYRHENYNFSKILYVVGNEQKLHFEQLKKVSYLMGYDFDLVHVNFGLVLIDGKKMSTRSGTNANLLTIIKEAILEAKNQILEKNPQLENIHDISKKIGVGAIIFNDLKNERNLDIDFDLENMLKFEGQTGPYVQYSSVRINSILKKETIKDNLIDYKVFKDEFYFELIKLVDSFVEIIDKARLDNSPSIIAKYLLALSQSFNRFYGKHKIIVDDKGILNANLALIKAVRLVLNEGLRLLGIDYLDEM